MKEEILFEKLPPLPPTDFFALEMKAKKRGVLPDTMTLLAEKNFAKVALEVGESGIGVSIDFDAPFSQAFYPDYKKGDAVEIFIDTRRGNSSFMTLFCHHFLFLPKEVEGVQALECTVFRSDQRRPTSESSDLFIESRFKTHSYSLNLGIPKHALYGFDVEEVDKIAFSYCLYNKERGVQSFGILPEESKYPYLWPTITIL